MDASEPPIRTREKRALLPCRRCRRDDALVTTYVNDGYVLEMCVCRWCGKGSLRGLGEWYDIVQPSA